ncbi:UDP-N-acetylmuramoyl-L-alanyl-D-glutamate--2,6-diaminopimelate ligase [Neisseria sp. Ec49-e6-T10]|uniref:UDP-N-acetylmuramoyl-L-alanyl-D-glutamate--2, 6-diaminopimelate ligase n=1 Tax=Neisseria sp. Ec49-e6-T10 TaxID=3140744 RepID=UPI003EC00B18
MDHSIVPNSLDCDFLKPFKDKYHHHISADSRKIDSGYVFLACQGEHTDGRSYIASAIEQGADCVLWDDADQFQWTSDKQIDNLPITNLSERVGEVAAYFLDEPSRQLNVIGVTGTNGKTSITQWLAQALDLLQERCAIIGTVGNGFFDQLQDTTHTTPDAVTVQHLLSDFSKEGAKAIAMEVSSHGLDQYRVNGVHFNSAIFTNLTRDHLDYHGSFEEYGEAKSRLFLWPDLKHAIINVDDTFGQSLYKRLLLEKPKLEVVSYGFSEDASVRILSFKASLAGMSIDFQTPWGSCTINTTLLGRFNAQNLAATLAVLCAQGYSLQNVCQVLPKIKPATGRMDCLINDSKPLVVIDYAHTPDALEKALITLQEIKPNNSKLWCVFGCGGNRDKGKRPLMGAVVQKYADCPVVTSDNPRLEEPIAIIRDILPAVPEATLIEVDRKKAIETVIKLAADHDIILIAGKGHEIYQDIAGIKHHFSDFEIAQAALAGR